MATIRIIGIDPSLVRCGWGVVETQGTKLRHVAHGVIKPDSRAELATRLNTLFDELLRIIAETGATQAGVEDAFLKSNAQSALKLGHARAACLLACAQSGCGIGEYAPRLVKKTVVGTGAADKAQVAHMINLLLPGQALGAGDAADALAMAVCHSMHIGGKW